MDSRCGVFSLAKRPDNLALWAKYTDSHRDSCLEFSDFSEFYHVYEILYSDKIPLSLSLQSNPLQEDFLYTKSIEWSTEKEARVLSKPPGLQVLPRNALRGIILGEHCYKSNEKAVVVLVIKCEASIDVKKGALRLLFLSVSLLEQ